MPHVTTAQIDGLVAEIRAAKPVKVESSEFLAVGENRISVGQSSSEIILVGNEDTHLLTEVSAALASVGISIEGLTALKVEEGSVVKLKVSDRDRTLKILNQTLDMGRSYGQSLPCDTNEAAQILNQVDYQAVSGDALLVELEDQAGTLADLMKQFREQHISLRSVRLLWRGQKKAVVELASSEPEKIKALLADQVLIH
jgi:histidine decarboxylase